MNLRHLLTISCSLSLGLSAQAFAVPTDAGSTDTSADATATADAGSTDAATGDATGSVPNTAVDACWDQKCPKEVAACKADTGCATILYCNSLTADAAKTDPLCATFQATQASSALLSAMDACGWKSCADPAAKSCKGNCGVFIAADKCHCDDACLNPQYNDCCADRKTICGDAASCAKSDCADGSTGSYADGSDSANTDSQCGCDAACTTNQDCCSDYDTTCKGKTPACVPACTNKDGSAKACGPDNCGGTCGTCANGTKCVSGACTAPDAGSTDTGSTTGGADAGGLVGDTTGGTGTTPADSTSTAKSSGCTAGTTGNSAGWMSALVGLGFIVAMRRRRA